MQNTSVSLASTFRHSDAPGRAIDVRFGHSSVKTDVILSDRLSRAILFGTTEPRSALPPHH